MNPKDAMIEQWRKEADEEYRGWLDSLDMQQEWASRLIEQGRISTTKEQQHAEVRDRQ